ncbi:MAG: ferritin-like protein [Clostridia bacterium]|jgi:rubrerythrin|nr:ferritin-like protein [Clostridia bacterium]
METLRCIVCGMKINDKNYGINVHSFIEKNTADNIIYCPFCGAGKSYLASADELYKLVPEALDRETLKVLDNAMKLEVFNGEFYQEASRMASADDVRNMFEALSSVEFTHAKVHMKLGGFGKLPALHKPDYSKYETDEQLLAEASKREQHAVHFYERNSGKIESQAIRQVLKALSEVELQHIEILAL